MFFFLNLLRPNEFELYVLHVTITDIFKNNCVEYYVTIERERII